LKPHFPDTDPFKIHTKYMDVSVLSLTDGCKHILVVEGALGPLVRLLESGSSLRKEKVAAAIGGLTSNAKNAWGIVA